MRPIPLPLPRLRHLRAATATALVALLVGCALGPDFHRPGVTEKVEGNGFTPQPLTDTASADVLGGAAQRFVKDEDIPGQWWELFHSEALNQLIERALKNNSDLQAAQAALRAANDNVYAQMGAYWPSVSGNFSRTRARTSLFISPVPANLTQTYTLYTANLHVSYTPDVFGLNRRTVESLQAQADIQRFTLEATYLTLTSNVVAAAIQEAGLRAQIDATQKIIKIESDLLDLFHRQFALGQVTGLDVAAQEAALAAAQQTLPPLQKQLSVQRDLLIALVDALPSEELPQKFELSDLQLPQDIPVSLPSKLIEQRPDVQQAEANLHSASAQIGVAIANRVPLFNIAADYGGQAGIFSAMVSPSNIAWDFITSAMQPIFQGGTLLYRERAARDTFDQQFALYRSAVVGAFQNVADSLHALQFDAENLKAADRAERAARRQLDLNRRQLDLGFINYVALLQAQQAYLAAVLNLAQAQASRYADTAALFQALGGGWWNRSDVVPKEAKVTPVKQ
ncbi:MAG: efflux transporter outer membrane subunit [Alphaproteobacteria bacterium]|nr:efflux transporter outer membrane subunit [Alphaproteobacteria bacterium]